MNALKIKLEIENENADQKPFNHGLKEVKITNELEFDRNYRPIDTKKIWESLYETDFFFHMHS